MCHIWVRKDGYIGQQVESLGLLELTTHSVQRTVTDLEEFGQVRVVEILGGDAACEQETVTLSSLAQGQPIKEVFNPQMIIDVEAAEGEGKTARIPISEPVLQRLLDGKTLGLALRPLGPINATFYALEQAGGAYSARLHFNVRH